MIVQAVAMREFTDGYRSKICAQIGLKSIVQVNRWRFNQMSTDNWCGGGWGLTHALSKAREVHGKMSCHKAKRFDKSKEAAALTWASKASTLFHSNGELFCCAFIKKRLNRAINKTMATKVSR